MNCANNLHRTVVDCLSQGALDITGLCTQGGIFRGLWPTPAQSRSRQSRLPKAVSRQVLNISKDGDSPYSDPAITCDHPYGEVFLGAYQQFSMFQFMSVASPVTGHLQEESGCLLHTLPPESCMKRWALPLPSPLWAEQARLSRPLLVPPALQPYGLCWAQLLVTASLNFELSLGHSELSLGHFVFCSCSGTAVGHARRKLQKPDLS